MGSNHSMSLSRRLFVQGFAAGGLLAAMLPLVHAGNRPVHLAATGYVPELTGRVIELTVGEVLVNYSGVLRTATAINGSIPAPTLRLREGDDVTIKVTNTLSVPTSIHWHGIILPYQMDGVPGMSFRGIMPGETFIYRFTLQQSGTYWYHSHSGMQEMTGMYGALIIEPKAREIISSDREYVVQLSDWTDQNPWQVFGKLKKQSDLYNFNQPTVRDFLRDTADKGLTAVMAKRQMWQQMRMNPTDLADLSAATMSYLVNGCNTQANWRGLFKPGERLRLRFINGSSNSFFDVRIPDLAMTVVQADGQNVHPVTVDEFRFGPGETYDVLVSPQSDAYTIFAQSMDRSGYARGTLAVAADIDAPVPPMDPVEWLSMTDMMGDMHHGAEVMDHSQHAMAGPFAQASQRVRHASTEYGPAVDMRVDTPRTNLDDPGIGLRNTGRRALTLADLHSLDGILDYARPEAEIELHLTGNMERYSWSIDGLEFSQSTPVHMQLNRRIRVILQNDTMMTHPMHLHGMWSDVENQHGEVQVRRHTIAVQPAQRLSFLTTPHDVGRWAWHCHLLFHMQAGMFREVVVS